ncbi:hypothetical protein [Pseudomonas sp.]|uniref:hypothetical protein n=1 Tax=Pseudomonas sp. TaxID=306 RepID=UPI002588ECAE|nr:hypothetical protein [Pseudomonas sp.]
MKVHWSAHIEYDHDGNDHEHFSECGVGRGEREGEDWASAIFKSEVTCKNCLKILARREKRP